jgi:hypothetical protein
MSIAVLLTFCGYSMLCLEVFQISLVGVILCSLFVLSQFRIVPLFCAVGLSFASLALFGREDLPSFPNYLGNFREG